MPYAMPTSSLRSKICGDSDGLLPIIGTMLIDSQPPAISTSDSPTRMRSAAIASAVTPDAQKRFTVTPPTVFGKPDSSAPMRATFSPCSASGIAQPTIASSITLVSSPGTCATADLIAWTSNSSGRVFLNAPRGALPIGVRLAATMYASCRCLLICSSSMRLRSQENAGPCPRRFLLPRSGGLRARRPPTFVLIAHRLAGLQHAQAPSRRLLRAEQTDNRPTLEREKPLLVHETARLDIAAAY